MLQPLQTVRQIEVRTLVMLLMLGGPIITLLILLAPGNRPSVRGASTGLPASSRGQTEPVVRSAEGVDENQDPRTSDQKAAQVMRADMEREASNASIEQAHWAKAQTILGVVGGFVGLGLLVYTHLTLKEAKMAAFIAATALEMADRAWIKISPEIRLKEIDESGVKVELTALMTNVGGTAAQHVRLIVGAIPYFRGIPQTRHWEIINGTTQPNKPDDVILPTETIERKIDVELGWDEIERSLRSRGIALGRHDDCPVEIVVAGAIRYTHGRSSGGLQLPPIYRNTLFHALLDGSKTVLQVILTTSRMAERQGHAPASVDFKPVPDWNHYAD